MTSPPDPIILLTTGGTIDKLYFDALSEFRIADTIIARLLELARVTFPFEVREVLRKDSLDLTDEDRALIAETVSDAPGNRIIVTHGTDTMTQTAATLAGVTGKTIALVGALSPARMAESDAAFNLGMAFATVQVAPPGVYIAMNGTVFRADEVTKDRAKSAFVRKET